MLLAARDEVAALMCTGFQPFVHASDIMRRLPERIVLAADQHKPSANIFHRYHYGIRQFCFTFRIAEDTPR